MKPKSTTSKPKNALYNIPIYEDPRFKEYENIPIEKFKLDKEKSQREFNALQKELDQLKLEYIKTKERTKDRENELRQHINNLLLKYRTRDPQVNLKNMKELEQQILENIKNLEEQSKQDIREKKKDMETRIKLRLVDSEMNYNKELEKKVQEQQKILRSLHEFTEDMKVIKNNYNSIQGKANFYLKENATLKLEIKNLESKNEQMKQEIMRLKHMNNKLSIKLMNNNENNNNDIENFEYKHKFNQKIKENFEKEQKDKLQKKLKEKIKNNNNNNNNLSNNENSNSISNNNINNNNRNIKLSNAETISLEKIIELVSDNDFVQKHFRECSIISNLLNIYDKTNTKIKNLNDEYAKLMDHHPIYDRLVNIIQNLKTKEISNKIHSIQTMSKRVINELLGNYIITMKKEQRKELINQIVNDSEITNLIYNDKLPNIMNIERQLGK